MTDRQHPGAAHWEALGEASPPRWRRLAFPGLFLVVLVQTVAGVARVSHGVLAVVGYLTVAGFCATYLFALPRILGPARRFLSVYLTLYALFIVGLVTAHEDALPMAIFLGVLAIARFGKRFVVIAVALLLADVVLPLWFDWPQHGEALTLIIVLAANYAFFHLLWANAALAQARTEIARLAAEAERQRIARDLHDLLGHSLTTITVKAGLARRLADTGDGERSRTEIAEIETIARGALADVRAAVTGYRDVTLAGELASGREVARAGGVEVVLPASTDVVDPAHHELFGWVTREALTKVVRHAHASRAVVTLGRNWIDIVDNGTARPAEAHAFGNGLRGLQERVEHAGGQLVSGPDEAGWRVHVTMNGVTP